METEQINFWSGEFGKNYTDRNDHQSVEAWNQTYASLFGISRFEMFKNLIGDLPKDSRILEVGCNVGFQLRGLQAMGFTNLYGIELQWYAVEKAKQQSQHINIVQGSAFDIPFKDGACIEFSV